MSADAVPTPAGQSLRDAVSANPQVAEAFYRHLLAGGTGGGKSVALRCLALRPRGTDPSDPPESLVSRFDAMSRRVRGVGACRWDGQWWIDRASGEQALVYNLAELSCESRTRCTARGGYMRGNLSASISRYELELRSDGWQVTGEMIEVVS